MITYYYNKLSELTMAEMDENFRFLNPANYEPTPSDTELPTGTHEITISPAQAEEEATIFYPNPVTVTVGSIGTVTKYKVIKLTPRSFPRAYEFSVTSLG